MSEGAAGNRRGNGNSGSGNSGRESHAGEGTSSKDRKESATGQHWVLSSVALRASLSRSVCAW